tara:strand:- start:9826 stop:9993 length:168 start_codon:yes stop_codon:yes gene_type:complete
VPTSFEDFFIGLLAIVALGIIVIVTLPVWWWTLKLFVSIIKAVPKIFWWITDRLR